MANRPFFILALCSSLLGCQYSSDQAMVGAWTTNRELTKIPSVPYPEFGRRLKSGINSLQLKLSSDHTFVLSGLQTGGKWSVKEGVLHLVPAKPPSQARIEGSIKDLRIDSGATRLNVTVPTPFGQLVLVLDKTA